MLSKQPLPSSNSSLDALPERSINKALSSQAADFLQRNAEQLHSIELFAELSTGFTIAFMEVNTDRDRQIVVEYFQNSDRFPLVQWVPITLAAENLEYFGAEVQEKLQQVSLSPDGQPVILISGLERSIKSLGEYPPILTNLNMERDSYPHILPYPIVLLLPSYAITRCARYAPDFWSWKSIEVRLQSEVAEQDLNPQYHQITPETTTIQPVPQSRFDLLMQLLAENVAPTINRARLLNQLGDAYCSIYENDQAEVAYRSALDIYDNLPLSIDRAEACDGLARLYNLQGKLSAALQLWQQALTIQREIGDRQGEATSLHQMSILHQTLGKLQQSLDLSQQSIKICREIGNRQGEAASLHQMSILHQALGKLQQALDFSQQSIKIKREIGNRQGEAASLHQMSIIHQTLGELQQALDLSQQSIKIKREIGNRQGEATSLHQMSIIYQTLGELQQALDLSQQSIKIIIEIGDRQGEAASLHLMSIIYQKLENLPQALHLCQQSIEIYRGIGNRQGEAASLHQMAVIAHQQGDAVQAQKLYSQAAVLLGADGNYGNLITVLSNLGTNNEPEALGYLAQSLWLTINLSLNLEDAITLIRLIYGKIPAGDQLQSLLGATGIYLCHNYEHPKLAQLTELSGKIMSHAVQQQGIKTKVKLDNWITQNRLNDPDYFLPELLQALEEIVGDNWLFDRATFLARNRSAG